MSKRRSRISEFIVGGLVLVLIALVASYAISYFQPSTEVRLGSGVFHVQVASTDATRQQGLSGVERLAANGGLLMVFQSDARWGIWMKDMKFPIDIVWMNNEKKVVHIVTGASPELGTSVNYEPKNPARYVLELPAGTVKNAGIKTGSTAAFTLKDGQ